MCGRRKCRARWAHECDCYAYEANHDHQVFIFDELENFRYDTHPHVSGDFRCRGCQTAVLQLREQPDDAAYCVCARRWVRLPEVQEGFLLQQRNTLVQMCCFVVLSSRLLELQE